MESAKEAERRREETERLRKQELARQLQERKFQADQKRPPEKRQWIRRPASQHKIPLNTQEAKLRIRLFNLHARARALHEIGSKASRTDKRYRIMKEGDQWVRTQDEKIRALSIKLKEKLLLETNGRESTSENRDAAAALIHSTQREINTRTGSDLEKAELEGFIGKFLAGEEIHPDEIESVRKTLIKKEIERQKEKVLVEKARFESNL
jgi:hypothetical protein